MYGVRIQINFNGNIFNLDGSTPLSEFKKYIDSLRIEDAVMIQKNVKKEMDTYLRLFPKESKINLEQVENKKISTRVSWKTKYFDLKKEFEEFKQEVKEYITELKHEIVRLNMRVKYLEQENAELRAENAKLRAENLELKKRVDQLELKTSYYDKKYNYEYDRFMNGEDIS